MGKQGYCESLARLMQRSSAVVTVVALILLGCGSGVWADEAGKAAGHTGANQADKQGQQEKKVDPQGRTDALTLLFYPDTPREDGWKPQWPPILTGGWGPLGKVTKTATERPAEQVPTAKYAWQKPLWEATETILGDGPSRPEGAWTANWSFFPAEEGTTLTWLTFPLTEPIPEGKHLVAMLRSEDDDQTALVLGSEKFPFTVRETRHGLIAQAARSLPPGRYAVVAGLAADDGEFSPRFEDSHIVSRVNTDQLRLSKVILADSLKKLDSDSGAGDNAFEISGFEVVPRANAKLRRGEELTIFYQVLGAGEKEGQLDLDVSYQLYLINPNNRTAGWRKAGRPVLAQHQTGATRAWTLPIAPQYPVADYKLEVTVKDNTGGGSVSQSILFSVEG